MLAARSEKAVTARAPLGNVAGQGAHAPRRPRRTRRRAAALPSPSASAYKMADGSHAGDSYGHASPPPPAPATTTTTPRKIAESLVKRSVKSAPSGRCLNVAVADVATSASERFAVVNLRCTTRQNGAERHEIGWPGDYEDTEEDCRKKRCVDRYDSSESSDSGVAVLSCTDCSGSSTASSDITDPGSPFSTASNHSEDSGVAAAPLHHHPPPRMPPAHTAHHPPWLWTETVKCPPRPRYQAKPEAPPPPPPKMQQGKITEYFNLRKDLTKPKQGKLTHVNHPKLGCNRREVKTRKSTASAAAPRKILPAPSKLNHDRTLYQFGPVIAAAAAAAAPAVSLTYLHAKTPKPPPPDSLFLPQFAAAAAALNCVKLNAIVLPSRLLSVDTALPTVLPARPKMADASAAFVATPVAAQAQCPPAKRADEGVACRAEVCAPTPDKPPDRCWTQANQKSPSPADSDSGVSSRGSLEVCVDETGGEPPKKSPILTQPKTIRFPAVQHQKQSKDKSGETKKSSPHANGGGRCRWNECAAQFDTSGALLEHLQVKHVISQSHANQEQYVCLWRGCKVHGRTSCSISWLERHVLAHAGTKPFRCIVDGCGQRFNSQLMLERHVNNHFNGDPNGNAKKSMENGGNVKLFKRNGRIIRFRRQPWSARMFDFIDSGIMEGLQHKLVCMTQARTLGRVGVAGQMVTVRGQIVARRADLKGRKEVLVRWHPNDVIADEWMAETDYEATRTLPITSLSYGARESLTPVLFPGCATTSEGRKHRRKPLRLTT